MKQIKLIAVLLCALVAISSAGYCPTSINDEYRQDEATNLEYFSFPSFYHGQYPFSVSANQHPEFQLLFTQNNIQLFSYIGSNGDLQIAVFCDGQISNSQQHWTSDFHAFGTFSPFGLRTVPDFKWVTLTDIDMCGRTDNNYHFNISISYADFWSDSPADAIWSTKSVERTPIGYCRHEELQAGGYNYVLSKGFWIEFTFDWGCLNFYVPANIPGFIFKDTILDFWDHCECEVAAK